MYDLNAMIERIKRVKEERGLTNDSLSALSGVPRGTLNKILGSETKDPHISSIIRIAHALGVSADYIILGKITAENAFDVISEKYARLDSLDRVKAESYIDGLLSADKYEPKKEKHA